MKKTNVRFLAVLIAACFISGHAFAAMINGSVKSTDSTTRKVVVTTTDAATGAPIALDVWVNAGATMSGVADLSELKTGDKVWLEAETDSEGNLRAKTLTKD